MLSANQVALAYLVASVFFILALKGLSSPLTSRRGNLFGMIGMALALATTLTLTKNWIIIIGGIALGGVIGATIARRVQMTAMPELVAFMHSLVGMAAVLIAIAAVDNPGRSALQFPLPPATSSECSLAPFSVPLRFPVPLSASLTLPGPLAAPPMVSAASTW